jgi:outer membrane immunogenic protein
VDSLGTVALRLGYAVDRILFYAKGGGAWAHDRFSITDIPSGITYARFDQSRWGWMAGGGVEYGVTSNWSMKVEYNYMDLGTERTNNIVCGPNFGCTGPGGTFNQDVRQRIQVVKGGINYRFGGPVTARY